MRILTESIYAYEVQIESNVYGLGESIFTFNTSMSTQDIEPGTTLRMRVRAYHADFYPHSNTLKLSQPSDWTEWSDWVERFDPASFDEARDNLGGH